MGFDRNLKMLLGVHDLSAGWWAGLMGLSSTSVSYWLNGHREPTAENLIQIAEFFEVPASALMRDTPEQFIHHVGNPERFASVESEIDSIYEQINSPKSVVVPLKGNAKKKK